MKILELQNLNKHFGGLHAINNVTFNVEEGIIKSVIGPNGAGKTTLFNLITGNLTLSSGKIIFNNKNITNLKPFEISKENISRTFQNIKLFPGFTVLETIMTGRHIRSKAGILSCMLNLPRALNEEKNIRTKAIEYLDLVGIADLKDELALNLAFGKQRLVEICRALATEPKLLFLDEPAAGLNIYETKELATLIKKINNLGITVLLVEHDMSLVMDISDEIVVLNYGKLIAEDVPEKIQRNKKVIDVYLGE